MNTDNNKILTSELEKIEDVLKCVTFNNDALLWEPTYLELCRYPGERFEEICSRILGFFFQPLNPHGLGPLFLKALKEILHLEQLNFDQNFYVDLEKETESDKRIDILITGKDFVICIENKISAGLYNDLNDYQSFVKKENSGKHSFFIILSPEGVKSEKHVDWLPLKYTDLFKFIKEHLPKEDSRYKGILMDWMQTVENKVMSNVNYPEEFCALVAMYSEKIRMLEDCRREIDARASKSASEKIQAFLVDFPEKDVENILKGWNERPFVLKNLKSQIDYIRFYNSLNKVSLRMKISKKEKSKIEKLLEGFKLEFFEDPKYGSYLNVEKIKKGNSQKESEFVGETVFEILKKLYGVNNA